MQERFRKSLVGKPRVQYYNADFSQAMLSEGADVLSWPLYDPENPAILNTSPPPVAQ